MLFWKPLLILKIFLKAASKFCSDFHSLSFVDFLCCTFIADFRNNLQDHRRLSEQLSDSQSTDSPMISPN